jgi:hypothetical protein
LLKNKRHQGLNSIVKIETLAQAGVPLVGSIDEIDQAKDPDLPETFCKNATGSQIHTLVLRHYMTGTVERPTA